MYIFIVNISVLFCMLSNIVLMKHLTAQWKRSSVQQSVSVVFICLQIYISILLFVGLCAVHNQKRVTTIFNLYLKVLLMCSKVSNGWNRQLQTLSSQHHRTVLYVYKVFVEHPVVFHGALIHNGLMKKLLLDQY